MSYATFLAQAQGLIAGHSVRQGEQQQRAADEASAAQRSLTALRHIFRQLFVALRAAFS